MLMTNEDDVPYGEDFHDPATAAAWAEAVVRKRPWRPKVFDRFVASVNGARATGTRILELGSGPGFLAEQVLERCSGVLRYTLLDFSDAMLSLSRSRLQRHAPKTQFLQADFKNELWPSLVEGPVDFVLSLQAVHELRHKRHAPRLYAQLVPLLARGGEVMICDHLPEGAHTERHRVLYLSIPENLQALTEAGLADAEVLWSEHNMALYRARTA